MKSLIPTKILDRKIEFQLRISNFTNFLELLLGLSVPTLKLLAAFRSWKMAKTQRETVNGAFGFRKHFINF